jgi:2-polyprenyl-6-methoxyphenol hydroxylase-like FAD-dependent oxidoreductase
MVGAALGCALGELGFRVAVIEAREPPADWPRDTVEARTSALTRGSEYILRNLGVWDGMAALRVSAYRRMHVWDSAGFGEIHFDCAEIGEPNLGHIVENRVIQKALWERLGELPTVTRLCPASVSALELGGEHPVLTLDTASTVASGSRPGGRSYDGNGAYDPAGAPSTAQLQSAGRSGVHAAIEHVGRPSGRHQHRDPGVAPTGTITLTASLIVAADGAQSAVRAMAGLGTRGWAYDQHAVVAIVRPARHHDDTAWQRFLPTGPVALLPIDDGRCNVVWSTTPEQAAELKAMPDDAFRRALTGATQARLGDIRETGPREVFPLRLQHAENYVEPGLALVGDAAHAVHPLAGQGVNLGLLDAATLADVLAQARGRGRPLGAMATLRRYERSRKGANLAMLGAMDAFKRLFSNDNPALYLARNLGLKATDLAAPVKHAIMRRALGVTGERPSLAMRMR